MAFRESSAIQVLVVDSSRMASQAISATLERFGFQIAYAGPDEKEALAVAERDGADVALVSRDIGTQQRSVCELIEKLRAARPNLQIVIVLEEADRDSTIHAFRAGARGILCRSSSLEVLGKCIARVHEGRVWASNSDVEHLISALKMPLRFVNARGADLLSKRELEVVQLATEGLINREIAGRLGLSENTVKNYLFRIFDKLGISSRVELILYAVSHIVNSSQNGGGDPSDSFKDESAMFRWCSEAAERLIVAQYAIGEMYCEGLGVPRDPETAYMWFCIAEKLSVGMECRSQDAQRKLQSELRREQLDNAGRRASDWLEKERRFTITKATCSSSVPIKT